MKELYRAIQSVPHLKWKSTESDLKIKCLYTDPQSKLEIRFHIQLWKMNEGTMYMVDFKNLVQTCHGVFPFFDVCCAVITELAVSS